MQHHMLIAGQRIIGETHGKPPAAFAILGPTLVGERHIRLT
jgi:hypothetical protein